MADKLLIVISNIDPAQPHALAAPLSQAITAAAMEYEVEIILTGPAGLLAGRDSAAGFEVQAEPRRTAYDLMQQAHAAGVTFKICTPTVALPVAQLLPEIDETVGDAYLISEAMDDATVTFTY